MIKRLISIGIMLAMCFSLSACGGGYVYEEGDFELTVTVDKTEVSVGDTVTITAKLENLSGRNVRIQTSWPQYEKLEDMIEIWLFEENQEHLFVYVLDPRPGKKLTIKKDAVIEQTLEYSVAEPKNYDAVVKVRFLVGRGFEESVVLYSEPLRINLKTEEE